MKSTRTQPQLCWRCGEYHDTASHTLGLRKPEPGDVSICMNCGALGRFNASLGVELLPEGAQLELNALELELVRRAQHFIQRRGPKPRGRPQ